MGYILIGLKQRYKRAMAIVIFHIIIQRPSKADYHKIITLMDLSPTYFELDLLEVFDKTRFQTQCTILVHCACPMYYATR